MLAIRRLWKSICDNIITMPQRCCNILGRDKPSRIRLAMNIIDPFVLPCLPLAWKHGLPAIPAVYFAISKKQILYIGSTKNLQARWSSHDRLKKLKVIDSVQIAWYEVSDISELTKLEGQAVSALKPLLNAERRVTGEGSGCIYRRKIS